MTAQYSDDELLSGLREFAEELGRTPTMAEMNEQGPYAAQTYYHRFGSWINAQEEAGLEVDDNNVPAKLSKEELLTALQNLADELDRVPTSDDMKEHGPHGLSTYYDNFGSWSNALEAANLYGGERRNQGEKISKKELLTELQDLASELGGTPTVAEMNEQGQYASSTYTQRFGSWSDAVREADLNVNKKGSSASKKELLAELHNLADEFGRAPTQREMSQEGQYSKTTYQLNFGSWNEAVTAAGYEPHGQQRAISREKLLTALQNLAGKLGRPPTTTDMDEYGAYSTSSYLRRFESWSNALQEAELEEPRKQTNPGEKELCEELQDIADELEQTPTLRDITEQSAYSAYAYRDQFGTWNNALRAAGLEKVNSQKHLTEKELCEGLRGLADELGHPPKTTDMKAQGPYSATPYYNQFGSWDDALEAAGLEGSASVPRQISNEELLTELQEFADELGRTPTNDQMDTRGPHSATTYRERFGSWNDALREAGLEVNRKPTGATEEELLTAIQELADELGRMPTMTEVGEQTPHSEWIYRNRFGSWNDALAAAGLLDEAP